MALVSPGVEVNVIDESFYTPAAAGTVPMIFVASASNKTSSSGAGIAAGTLQTNAGKAYLITSQRELGETFGDPLFYSDSIGNMIHGGELNEYGLQTAYSLLGVTNRAYVVRADLDTSKLAPSATAPGGEPATGAYWFDTAVTGFGILEWNAAAVTTTNGQSFSSVTPLVITEPTDLTNDVPKGSIGQIGGYAVDATTTTTQVWYKTAGTNTGAGAPGTWVKVGSAAWSASHAAIRASLANVTLTAGEIITINATPVTVQVGALTPADFAAEINDSGISGITAAAINGVLEIYSTGVDVAIANSGAGDVLGDLGITAATYSAPRLEIKPHTDVPAFKSGDAAPAPTGSIWIKTTVPNGGANFRVKQYNGDTALWDTVSAPVYTSAERAIFDLDRAGGGSNLTIGQVYVKGNVEESAAPLASYKIYSRVATGATSISSAKIVAQLSGVYTFDIEESVVGTATRVSKGIITPSVSGTTAAEDVAAEINAAGFTNIVAFVDSNNRIVIQHKLGGEIRITEGSGFMTDAGFVGFDPDANAGAGNASVATANLYIAPTGDATNDYVASNWKPLAYTATGTEPLSLTADGEIWYNSIVDEVDIMLHNGTTWVGYQSGDGGYTDTDPAGPIVSAAEPTAQSDASALVTGDLWISTADVENYPAIYRYNSTLAAWVLLDKADQTTENGVLFADARYADNGGSTTVAPSATIAEMLTSDYLDPDAPDPALYPKGMLLWNLRRSGFNVKRFERNYIDVAGTNPRQADASMDGYYPHRWVTASGNNEDGSGTFGRHAQRKTVVQALQAMVNSNQEIRDEESRQFNLMACPGYPELIGEMISLNYDRRLTGFVVGDTPARLTPDATSLNEWGQNVRLAVEDNDEGLVSRDEYFGIYYPWGFTSDNAGNNVVVPPSHMALRTIVLNDQVAFPWFAPAGTRRGGVTNATATGYVSAEGEFVSVALNTGQRDTLYSNAINPITFISGAGLVVFGQKTRARNASALDRINVARLVVYLRGQLELLARPYLFEPNDKITRDQVKAAADSLLLELVGLRALYDFLVVCDESNNTPSRIDRNELYLDIAIEPVKAIEFIYIPLRIKNTGEIAALG
jgi:hypothetical protein